MITMPPAGHIIAMVLSLMMSDVGAIAQDSADDPVIAGEGTPVPAPPDRINISDAVVLTLLRHPEIARASAALARGKADLGAAKSVWTPQLSYQANIGPNMLSGKSGSGLNDNMAGPSIYIQQQVWDFGRSRGEIGYARSTESQRRFEVEAVADLLAEQTSLSFLEVKRFELLSQETVKHVRSLEQLRELIGLRVNAGISDKSDLMLAHVRVDSAQGDAIQAQSSLTIAKAALANLIGGMPRQYDDAAAVISRFENADADPDLESLPAVVAAQKAEQAAAARVGQAKAERFPKLGLQLGYTRNNYTYNNRDNSFMALMTVTGDLYRRGNQYLVQAAQEDRRAAQAVTEATLLDLRGKALTAQQEIRGGYQRVEVYRRQEEQAITASRIFLEEYKLGKRTLTELLNTQLEIYRAASARIAADYDIMAARVKYENICGRLRVSLGLPAHLIAEDDNG